MFSAEHKGIDAGQVTAIVMLSLRAGTLVCNRDFRDTVLRYLKTPNPCRDDVSGKTAQLSISASTVASLMSTALLAVSRVRFRPFANVLRCASASARSGSVSSSR